MPVRRKSRRVVNKLNEFLKEHKTVQEQGVTIAELKKEIAALTATVKEQAAQIQKVSAHLDVSKTAPQIVLNNQQSSRAGIRRA